MTRYPDFDDKVLIDYLNSNQQFNEILNKLQLEDRSFTVGDLWIALSIKTSYGQCHPIIEYYNPDRYIDGDFITDEDSYPYSISINYGDGDCFTYYGDEEKKPWYFDGEIPDFSEELISIGSSLWNAFKALPIPYQISDHHWIKWREMNQEEYWEKYVE